MTTKSILSIVLLAIGLILALSNVNDAAFCHGHPKSTAHRNDLPFIADNMQFVKSSKNGKRFLMQSPDSIDKVHVLHVYGSPYEMGFAHGELMRDEVFPFITAIWEYMKTEVSKQLGDIPKWLADMIATFGIEIALDYTFHIMSDYIGDYIVEELHGLADGSGLDFTMLRRVHMIGELTRGRCSFLGAWGQSTKNGETLQLRAFDWIVDGAPFRSQPAIVVYHPDRGNRFANIGFIGWIGAFSGMNDKQMGISEIGVSYPDDTFGRESRIGVPFVFLLRDILQFDTSLQESIKRIENAARTCNLILGVGDGKAGQARGFQYAHYHAKVIDDTNLLPANDTWHPKIKNTVYWGMDWNCPPYSQRLSERITANYGKIDAETIARDIAPLTTTGDLQVSIYDLTNNFLYLSTARRDDSLPGDAYAYDRPFFKVNMTRVFQEPL